MPRWQDIAREKCRLKRSLIPQEWHLDPRLLHQAHADLRVLPRNSGILSARELDLTENLDAVDLTAAIREKRYTASEVCLAFCKVCILTRARGGLCKAEMC